MIFYIQLILIIVLVLILAALYLDEKQKKQRNVPRGRLTQIWDGSERRHFVRVSSNVAVRYSFPKGPDNVKPAKTKDISIGGMCIIVNEKLIPRAKLSLAIEPTASDTPILAKGEVAWVKENMQKKNAEGIRYFDIGIEFKYLLPKDRKRLSEFVKESEKTTSG